MAYTIERLKRVCDVFVKPAPKKPKATDLADHAGPLQLYDFRPRVKDGNLKISLSCMDNDETEDYEPSEDRTPRKRKVRSNGTSPTTPRPSKKASDTSESSAALQRRLIDNDSLKEKQQRDDYLSSLPFDYNFRSRGRLSEISGNAIDGLSPAVSTEVSCDGVSSVTPSSRSCLACRELGLECTMERNPNLYPCEDCRADKLDCILSPPPVWKRPCENCKSHRKGQHCSYYSGDYDHSKPCQFCQQHGFKCVAGPARHIPSAVQNDQSTGQATDKPQTSRGSTYSSARTVLDRNSRSSTSIARAEPAPTYELVTTLGPGLPPVLAIASDGSSSPMAILANQSATDRERSSPVQLGEPEEFSLDDQIARRPTTTLPPGSMDTIIQYVGYNPPSERKTYFVRTELPHPLKVMYDPSEPNSAPCHWCHNFAYGITGLGIKYPMVFERGDGKLIELKDGHTNDGIEPSRMCIQCTFKRVSVILCSHDQIAPLFDYSSDELDIDAIFGDLVEAYTALEPKAENFGQTFPEPDHPWCSLCREPAFWRCDSSHPYSREQESTIPIDPGCGLLLCDYCAYYTKVLHGDLDSVYEQGKNDSENGVEFRADVHYLLQRSENNVFWHQVHGKE